MLRQGSWVLAALAAIVFAGTALPNQARVLESDSSEILIELATDDYSIESVVHGGESLSRVAAPGYVWTTEPGLPRLPMKGVLVGVPFGVEVELDVLSVDAEPVGPVPVEPAPFERIAGDSEFPIAVQDFVREDRFYSGVGTHPPRVAKLGFDSRFRHQRIVQVLLYPFAFSARSGCTHVPLQPRE